MRLKNETSFSIDSVDQLIIFTGSAGKESACKAGDLGSIPRLGRSPGGGKGYPLQHSGLENSVDCIVHGVSKSWTRLSDFHSLTHSWHIQASLIAQLVQNPPAMQETWVQSLGWEDPLEEGKATYSSRLAWRIPWTVQSMGLQRAGCN